MADTTMIDRLKQFMECEGRSCSFDPEVIVIHGSGCMVHGSRLMVQGMKCQNGISKMKSINMGDDKKEKIMIVHGEHKDDVTLANIQARIFLVRGVQVMLDRDLAVFYKVDWNQ